MGKRMERVKANELRIGNLIYAVHEESESIRVVDIWFLEHQLNYEEDPYADEFSRGWWYTPIPLTPELLEMAGFEYIEYRSKWQKSDFIFQLEDLNELSDGFGLTHGFSVDIAIKYLHQLQNLFFSLCGKELEIKL